MKHFELIPFHPYILSGQLTILGHDTEDLQRKILKHMYLNNS
jgi:hypothetical protein